MTEALPVPDSLAAWIARYQRHAVAGTRPPAATAKIALHLGRFQTYFVATYGHDRLSACVRRDRTRLAGRTCARFPWPRPPLTATSPR